MYLKSKRYLDVIIAISLIVLLLPLIGLVAVSIRIFLGAPTTYASMRPGLNGQAFRMLKFRSMTNATDEKGRLLPDEQRITKFGKILRSSSMDELPALINVIKGEMSLVGPRPLLVEYLPLYSPEQSRRHNVRPGITGYAQVNGRNALSWEEKFQLDCYYVDNVSLRLDLKILWKTVYVVLLRKDITDDKRSVGMGKFTGNVR